MCRKRIKKKKKKKGSKMYTSKSARDLIDRAMTETLLVV